MEPEFDLPERLGVLFAGTDPVLFAIGGGIVAAAFLDFMITAVGPTGLGPISALFRSLLFRPIARVMRLLERLVGWSPAAATGPLILSAVATVWVTLHVIGYTLMFAAGPSLVGTDSTVPASIADALAWSGSSLSTVGSSPQAPTTAGWDALSMIAAMNGMIVLTLSVSFVLNTLATVRAGQRLALRINARLAATSPPDFSGLGAEVAGLVVAIRSNPLAATFLARDARIDVTRAIGRLAHSLRSDPDRLPDPDGTEIGMALSLLVDHMPGINAVGPEPARRWALRRSL